MPEIFNCSIGKIKHAKPPKPHHNFVICGMATPNVMHKAKRLIDSLAPFDLPYLVVEVPTVHSSMSTHGSADATYCKPNFILNALEMTNRPVLYVDVDCTFHGVPSLLEEYLGAGADMAILNWLALDDSDAYIPIDLFEELENIPRGQLYTYSHGMTIHSEEQLVCSGAVQLWANTLAARMLLNGWMSLIVAQPGSPDDWCLDFVFNNQTAPWPANINVAWLPKSYARYPWWIFDEPIIEHPDFPSPQSHWKPINDEKLRKRYYPERAVRRNAEPKIPRDWVINVFTGELLRHEDGYLVPSGRTSFPLWPGQ